jgi:hypothetical protein
MDPSASSGQAWATLVGVAAVPLIVGLVQVAKGVGLPDRWAPVGAIVVGLALRIGWELTQPTPELYPAVVGGLALGLAACGLYSGAKHVGESLAP